MGDEGGHTIQQRETRRKASWETRGDKTLGKADTPSSKGKQEGRLWETRPQEGGHTIQQREARKKTSCETRGDKTLGKADTQSNKGKQEGVQWETKADTPSNKGKQEGRQAVRQRETRPSGRRTHHPTKGNKKGDKGRQDLRKGGHTIQHQGGHKKGYNGRQSQEDTLQQRETRRGTMARQRESRPSVWRTHHPTPSGHLQKAFRTLG